MDLVLLEAALDQVQQLSVEMVDLDQTLILLGQQQLQLDLTDIMQAVEVADLMQLQQVMAEMAAEVEVDHQTLLYSQ